MEYSESTRAAFKEWFGEHAKAFPTVPWPAFDADKIGIFSALAKLLVKNGLVDADHLFEVTRRMVLRGDKSYDLQQHIQQLIKVAMEFHREHYRPESPHPAGSIDEARVLSRDCDTCHGMGIFVAHRQESYHPDRADNTVNVYCACPYGQAVRDNHKANDPSTFKRFYDLNQHPFLADPVYHARPSVGADVGSDGPFVDRARRIATWYGSQSADVRAAWAADATAGMPQFVAHPLVDHFVAGVIAHRHPEFDPT